jgi:pimeloyl-ACP methyl ester carboxylesterase
MKKLIFFLLLTGFLILSCGKENNNLPVNEISAVRGYENWYIGDFRCGLFVPPSYDSTKKYPLIVFLHGYTDTTTWNLGWYNEPFISEDPCIVLTPKCPKEEKRGWGNSYDSRTSPMMAKAYEMMDMVEKAFNVDKDRYYIYGSSMGGYGTYGAIRKNPDMFAAAYVECGGAPVDMAPVIAKIPFWMFHGSDDPTVPVQPTRDLYKAVLEIGGTMIRYTEYPGVGHNVWDYTGKETTLPYWLLAQRKGSIHAASEPVSGFYADLLPGNVVSLKWNVPIPEESVQDNRIWYCKISRNGNVIKEVYNNQNQYTDSTKFEPGSYVYVITAVNYYFRESVPSQQVTITTGN